MERRMIALSSEAQKKEFVSVRRDSGVFYGGDQHWFSRFWRRLSGCSVVAAGNIFAYLAQAEPERFGGLFPHSLEESDYMTLLNKLFRFMPPGFMGAHNMEKWIRQVRDWAAQRGVSLRASVCSAGDSRERCAALIREGLERDRPVAALNLWNGHRDSYDYGWHWLVITGFTRDENGREQIIASTWGQRRLIDWEQFYNYAHRARKKGGFVYFE